MAPRKVDMRVNLRSLAILVLALLSSGQARPPARSTSAPDLLAAFESGLITAGERVSPAVVAVRRFVRDPEWWSVARKGTELPRGWKELSSEDLLYPGFRPDGGGSGFITDANGHILSLASVAFDTKLAEEDQVVDVEVGDEHFAAEIVSLEPTIDLAILKFEPKTPAPFLTLASGAEARVGQLVLAFGDPPGPERVLKFGVVAAPPLRECYQYELSATYLQTSAPIPAGALGGPLVNLAGQVIGINTRRGDTEGEQEAHDPNGSGYALPIDLASAIYESLLLRESRRSPWLGVSVRSVSTDASRTSAPTAKGIYVDNLFQPSPAARAGIQVGDVLEAMDNEAIDTVYDFQRILYRVGIGAIAEVNILRDGKPLQFSIKLEERPPDATTR